MFKIGVSAGRCAIAALAASAWLISQPVGAVVRTWSNLSGGTFTDIGNWAPNDAYPGPSDAAEFNSGPIAYTVTLPGSPIFDPPPNYVVDRILVRTNEVTLRDNRSEFINSPSLTAANPDDAIVIGVDPGETAILNTTLLNLTAANLRIGHALTFDVGGAVGTLNVNAGTVNISDEISVGVRTFNAGRLNVRNNGRVNTNLLNVGSRSNIGRGMLLIEAGGSVVSNDANLGLPASATPGADTVLVTGAGSTWTNNHLLNAGPRANLTVQDRGALITGDARIRSGFPEATPIVRITGAGSTWTNSGDIRIGGVDMFGTTYGAVILSDGAQVSVDGQLIVEADAQPGDFGSFLSGNGTIVGEVVNDGYVQPGLRVGSGTYSPGVLRVDGSYRQSAAGTLGIAMVGTTTGSQYDQLKVSGAVELNGALFVGVWNPSLFQPSAGDDFDILDWASLSGTFSTLDLPQLQTGLRWDASQLYATGVLSVAPGFDADFDEDLDVDGADLVRWRSNYGLASSATHMHGDADFDLDVDAGDFLIWQRQVGSGIGAAAVPEPAAWLMATALASGLAAVRPRRWACGAGSPSSTAASNASWPNCA